jgi:two-component system response regulator NreC
MCWPKNGISLICIYSFMVKVESLMTTIILAEDHHVVREGIQILLEDTPEFSVIANSADGTTTVALVERLKPDVLITDLMMPGLNGMEVIRQALHRSPETKVIVLSMYSDEPIVAEAIAAGAHGYIQKDSDSSNLVKAVQTVCAGRRYLSPPLTDSAIEAYLRKSDEQLADPFDSLSMREREVLQLVAEGNTSAQIGEELSISSRTVEVHRANAMRKLGLRRQADVIRFFFQRSSLPLGTAAQDQARKSDAP